ncbi:desmoglein-2 isoform X1 [Engystomops pustulosus]|uniref:desmoglein-2 isoform X1 n=1 Tax=Engystomops pustulosus TaxID=76066 RepID=UPI003AFAFE6C
MKRTPAGGGGGGGGISIMLLLMVILDFGQGLHLERVKRAGKPGEKTVYLARHKREWIIPPVSIYEEQDNSFKNPIARIQSDIKLDRSRRIRYSIIGPGVTQAPLGIFLIDENSGDLNVTGIVDREEISMFFLKGYARDQNGVDVEPPIDLRVKVLDINDNDPIFAQDIFTATVEELSVSNSLVMVLNATDADEPNTVNSQLAYRVLSQEPGSSEFVVTKNGEIRTTSVVLDREKQSSYTLVVEVRDLDGDLKNGKANTASVKVKVKDVNDNIPILEKEQYEGAVEENVANVEILRMKVFDNDQEFTDNWFAKFDIISGNEDNYFEIVTDTDTNEGVLMIVKEADYEVLQSAELSVVVSNRAEYHSSIKHLVVGGGGGGAGGAAGGAGGGGGKPIPIKVQVKNVREGPVFKPRRKILTIAEGKTVLNKVIGSYQAYDSDTGKVADHVKYAKEYDPDNWFMIDQTTAEIKLIKIPDRESIYVVNGTYVAKILAISEDLPGKTATGTIAIEVEDVNDNCPVLINPDQTVCNNAKFINLTAMDPDGFPNGAPLKFVVVDDPPGNAKLWSIGKTDAVSAQLIPKDLWEGPHKVKVLITDNQGLSCPETQALMLTVCTCNNDAFACSERRTDSSIGLGGGAIALMILACLLLLLVPLLLLLCSCGSGGKGFLAVDGPEQSMLIHNKEGPEPVDAAAIPATIGTIGAAGLTAGAGAGMAYGMQSMDGYGYNKEMYHSSMMMDRQYEENQVLMSRGEMTARAGSSGGVRMMSGMASAAGAAAGAGYGYGVAGSAGSQAALNEEFIKGYFYDRVMGCADEDMAQASKDCILIYSQEGTGSIAGSVGCCSIIESEFEDDYLDDLGLKFKALADICQGVNSSVEISQYKSYEQLHQAALEAEAITDIRVVENEETVEEHHQAMDHSYMSSESQVERLEPQSMATEESYVTSRYVQEPVMRGNLLVTEKSYTTAPTIILEPVRQQNVLVTERIIRPATSLHNVVDINEGENVLVTERVIQADKGFSGFVSEPRDSQYMLVTERLLDPSSNLSASSISIPDQSVGRNVMVTERHYTPITTVNGSTRTAINGGARIPVEVSGGQNMVKESVSILDGGVIGQTHLKQGGYLVEELNPASSNVEKSSSRVTKYNTVHYTRS